MAIVNACPGLILLDTAYIWNSLKTFSSTSFIRCFFPSFVVISNIILAARASCGFPQLLVRENGAVLPTRQALSAALKVAWATSAQTKQEALSAHLSYFLVLTLAQAR